MGVLNNIMAFLSRYAPQAMAGGIFLGLLMPGLASQLRPYLAEAVWGLLFLAMVRIEFRDVVERMRRPMLVIALVTWMLVITPLLMTLILMGVDLRPGLEAALILTAASSSLFSTPTLGIMFGLDGALLLIVLVITTLLVPITLPLVALTLLGFDMGADPFAMMGRMSALVLSSAAAAVVVRRLMGGRRVERSATFFESVAVVLLIGFAIGIMDGVTHLAALPAIWTGSALTPQIVASITVSIAYHVLLAVNEGSELYTAFEQFDVGMSVALITTVLVVYMDHVSHAPVTFIAVGAACFPQYNVYIAGFVILAGYPFTTLLTYNRSPKGIAARAHNKSLR